MRRRFFSLTMIVPAVTTLIGLATGAYAAPLTVGLSMPDLSESFWTSLAYGVDDEAKKLGVTIVKLNAGGDANVNQQISHYCQSSSVDVPGASDPKTGSR